MVLEAEDEAKAFLNLGETEVGRAHSAEEIGLYSGKSRQCMGNSSVASYRDDPGEALLDAICKGDLPDVNHLIVNASPDKLKRMVDFVDESTGLSLVYYAVNQEDPNIVEVRMTFHSFPPDIII